MPDLTLTLAQARRYLLAHQGLWPPHGLQGKEGVLSFVRHVGCIQYDPLNIVGTNPKLVLQARVADFTPALLAELLFVVGELLLPLVELLVALPQFGLSLFQLQLLGFGVL